MIDPRMNVHDTRPGVGDGFYRGCVIAFLLTAIGVAVVVILIELLT